MTDGAGILFKTVTEALVSNIEERNQLVLNADVNNLGPLFLSQVIACGIVAAGMQNHNGVFFQTAEALKHGREVDAVVFFVIVRILADFETSLFKNCNVVLPCRCADNGFRIFENSCKEVCADFKSTGTAERLNGNGMLFFDDRRIGTENQLLNAGVKSRNTGDRKISMRLAGFKDSLLGFGNDAQKRYFAVFGAVHADTQINFLVAGVGFESFVEAENGIVGSLSDNIKNGFGHEIL